MDQKTQKELCDIVKHNYEEIAEEFHETRRKYLWPELIKLAKNVKDGDRVLDVGCGSGRLAEAFMGKTVSYIGVDACRRLIEIAREEEPDCRFLIGDVLELGLIPEIEFDYVFCIAMLQHIPGSKLQVDALRQMRNKIKPGGQVIVSVWNMRSRIWADKKPYRRLIFKFMLLKLIGKNKMDFGDIIIDWKNPAGQTISKRYYHAFRGRELKRLARKAGLRVKKFYKDQYNYYLILKR